MHYQMSLQRRSEQACLARQDLSHTHLAHVQECATIVITVAMHHLLRQLWQSSPDLERCPWLVDPRVTEQMV